MRSVVTIVEGDGEVAAVPVLLRRVAACQPPLDAVEVRKPIRVRRDRFLNRDEEFRRTLLLAAHKCSQDGWILIFLDADDDCPAQLAPAILQRARTIVPHRRLSVVLATREFEAWFVAAAPSLHGRRGFAFDEAPVTDPEGIRDAKGWISERMGAGRYRERTDQPAFAAIFDLAATHHRSRSFRKLCQEWSRCLQ